jgi:hypothetical protein
MVILQRFCYGPWGVFGRLKIGDFESFTVELPWRDNQPSISCIPCGVYRLKLSQYYRGGYPAFEICDVPNRSRILIHVGNTIDDILGCVCPGKKLGFLRDKWAVLRSRKAFRGFMAAMDGTTDTFISVENTKQLAGLQWQGDE